MDERDMSLLTELVALRAHNYRYAAPPALPLQTEGRPEGPRGFERSTFVKPPALPVVAVFKIDRSK
jgi:hypothetical protein